MRRRMVTRRSLLAGVGSAVAGTGLSGSVVAQNASDKKIDAHGHLSHHSRADWKETDRQVIETYDKLEIDQGCCSILPPQRPATPESFRECNQFVYEAMRRFPGRVLGYAFVNPGHGKQALEEVRQCVET